MSIDTRARFGDDAAAASEALYRTQPETFAGAFGSGADADDGINQSRQMFDMMKGATLPALALVLVCFECIVRLATPFEAAMHWLEVRRSISISSKHGKSPR